MKTPFSRPDPPVCETCGNTKLQRYGVHNNKQSYHCPPCRRTQTGYPVPPPKPNKHLLPCPKCHGATRIVRTHKHRHQLICRKCHHNFTDVYVNSPLPRQAKGAFRHRKTFSFCTPLPGITIARVVTDAFGDRVVRIKRITPAPDPAAVSPDTALPDAFPAALQKMRDLFREQKRKPFREGNPPIVGLFSRITLCMDDRAKQGLLLAMTRYNTDHQNALRQLLIDSHARGDW